MSSRKARATKRIPVLKNKHKKIKIAELLILENQKSNTITVLGTY